MARKLVWLLVALLLSAPAWGQRRAGTISGTVRDSAGIAQMGAMVEVFSGSIAPVAKVFTDAHGVFAAVNLTPGIYYLKISAPSFLPLVQEGVGLRPGTHRVVNVTLNTLFEALQVLPAKSSSQDDDDWKWTLRSSANRPILRMLDDGTLVVAKAGNGDKVLRAHLAFLAGADETSGGSGMTTAFRVERSLFSTGTLALDGNIGYSGGSSPETVIRTSYSRTMPDGSQPQMTLSLRRMVVPSMADHDPALQELAVTLSDRVSLLDFIDLNFGSQYEIAQFMGSTSWVRPFGDAKFHLSPNTIIAYRYTTTVPNFRPDMAMDGVDAETDAPRISLMNSSPVLEHARHREVSASRRVGRNRMELAWYSDRISTPALTGIGSVSLDDGDFLPNYNTGTFTWGAPNLDTRGWRVLAERRFSRI